MSDLRLKINVPDVVALCQEVIEDLSPREREVQDTDGRSYSMWVRPYRTAENRIEGVLLALFDVTERKQAAEARYRRLFEAAPDGIVIADAGSGEIVDVNPFLVRFSGYPRARLGGRQVLGERPCSGNRNRRKGDPPTAGSRIAAKERFPDGRIRPDD